MTLGELVNTLQWGERIRIYDRDKKELFREYVCNLSDTFPKMAAEVDRVEIRTDIYSRDWRDKGFIPPEEPDIPPEMQIKDLCMTVYIGINLK